MNKRLAYIVYHHNKPLKSFVVAIKMRTVKVPFNIWSAQNFASLKSLKKQDLVITN